ncbi:MAG: c-type cytochrome domain-containing protein, partial [Gammaproteobacteria bacterium]
MNIISTAQKALLNAIIVSAISGCAEDNERHGLAEAQVDFNWDIRPILSDKCFACHGPDQEGLKAGLRLDVRDLAIAELPESPGKYAIV